MILYTITELSHLLPEVQEIKFPNHRSYLWLLKSLVTGGKKRLSSHASDDHHQERINHGADGAASPGPQLR